MANNKKTPRVQDQSASAGLEIAEARIADWKVKFFGVPQAAQGYSGYSSRSLDLSELGLEQVPAALRELTELEYLSLARNRIRELPDWIGGLAALQELHLELNRLLVLPESIGELRRLRSLELQSNQLESLPHSLRMLDLNYLGLAGNRKLGLPDSLVSKLGRENPRQLLRYYYESRGEGRLLELKLLIVGRGRAGKTTLVKRLMRDEPDDNELETHSISIGELALECRQGKVRARAWDFGGQEILHSTHQFFLTERSLYLLVLEPRTGLAQRDAEYWLKLIENQGGRSPVIVVLNWSHGRHWRIDQVRLRRKFPFVVDFLSTDALYGEGIEELRRVMLKTVEEKMRDVWLPFPVHWREIKDTLAGMRDNFLTYRRYADLCSSLGEDRQEAQADLAAILHALGSVLYFGEDPRLHDTRVLNPRWVTGGVYAVLRSRSVAENNGQLTVGDMPSVLREAEQQRTVRISDYPPETYGFILDLMKTFQLCYAGEEEQGKPTRYLVPELLPEFEPEMKEPWEEAPVHLKYRYEILPPGLLPRFIVRTHHLSDGAPHWRHGVVLQHADARALIRSESDKPEVHIFLLGTSEETRRLLAAMVRRELEGLHREMKVQPVEELRLTGEGDLWASVKALEEMEMPSRPKLRLSIQPEGTAEVDVPRELNKLVPEEARAVDRDPRRADFPVRLFVSYAHDDERHLKRLDSILGVLEQQHGLESWRDKRLIAGEEWDDEIRRRLERTDIFLFVASQASLVRPYVRDSELQRAKELREVAGVEIAVVKLEPCACDDDPYLAKLHRLAGRFGSIAEARLKSEAWEQVRKDLLPIIEKVRKKKFLSAVEGGR